MFQAELSLLMMDEDDDKQHFSLKTIQDEEKKSKKKKNKNKKKAIEEKRVQDTFKVRDTRSKTVYAPACCTRPVVIALHCQHPDLMILASYEATIAKICNFRPVIQLIKHLFKI